VTNQRKDSHTTVTTAIFGFVISCLLASCSGGGSPSSVPSASDGSIGTDRHHLPGWPLTAASASPSPAASALASASPAATPKAPLPTPTPTAIAKAPAPTPTPVHASGPAAPDHVQNFGFYGVDGVNANIPAAFMAAHVDIAEADDVVNDAFAPAFKAAGGKMAIAYTDPSYVPFCPPPFTPPAGLCTGAIGNLVAGDESAWVHDSSGARIHRYADTYYEYQDMLNVGSPSAVNAYAQMVRNLADPHLDGVFADDSGKPLSSMYYRFDANGVEFQTDAQWIAGETAQLAATGMKVLYNGGTPQQQPAYGGAFLTLPEVIGQMNEGCFMSSDEGAHMNAYGRFQNDANGLLAIQAFHKLAVCLPNGAVDPASRTYTYASFMLVYDPSYSVLGVDTVLSDNEAVYPEIQLVPQQPLTTASTDVAVLLHNGVYVREFASCSISSAPIGPCAAVVNSSTASATIPPLAQSYAHSIALDPQSLYGGGLARVVSGAPSSIAPGSAAILVR
jgi:hypothetical protein